MVEKPVCSTISIQLIWKKGKYWQVRDLWDQGLNQDSI